MKNIFLTIFLIIASNTHAERRIIGGTDPTEAYPWMVGIYNADGIFCGGALIDPYWVLTAAHCLDHVDPYFHHLTITTNQIKLNDFNNIEIIKVKHFLQHPAWNTRDYNFPNDIALLQLEQPSKQKPILMVSNVPTVNLSRALGFGTLSLQKDLMSNLKQVDLPIVSNEVCQAAYQGIYTLIESQICAGFPEGQKDTCFGDSGSPLIVRENNQWKQLGIVSFGGKNGIDCAGADAYGVYTNVTTFKTAITDYINDKIQLISEINNNNFTLQLLETTTPDHLRATVDVWVGVEISGQFYFITGNVQTPQLSLQPQIFKSNIQASETQQVILSLASVEKLSGDFRFYAAYTLNGEKFDYLHSNVAQLTVHF
jgi:secreted trypsin-like serine protease